MEHLDIHVALEACDIVVESATSVAILKQIKDGKAYYLTIRSSRNRPSLEDKSSAAPRSGRTKNELPGTSVARQHILYSLGSMGWGRCVQVSGASIVSTVEFICPYLKELWLAVDEVVHHDDVVAFIVVWTRGNVAGLDPDRGDAGVIKHNAEEGQASIARGGRDETAE